MDTSARPRAGDGAVPVQLPLATRRCMGSACWRRIPGVDAPSASNGASSGSGPVAQWLEPTAHNGLVGGSSPPGPTTHSIIRICFPVSASFAVNGLFPDWRTSLCGGVHLEIARMGGLSLLLKIPFPRWAGIRPAFARRAMQSPVTPISRPASCAETNVLPPNTISRPISGGLLRRFGTIRRNKPLMTADAGPAADASGDKGVPMWRRGSVVPIFP